MTQKQLAEAINEQTEIIYNGALYRCVGYKLVRNRKGVKEYYAGLFDLKNERTVIWVGLDDI